MKSHVSPGTWVEDERAHKCCGSHSPARHCKGCAHYRYVDTSPHNKRQDIIEPENPLRVRVLELKSLGLNSGQVAARLGMELFDVNKLYV